MQRVVTRPSSSALSKYQDELNIFQRREGGYQKATRTVRQLFKNDAAIMETVPRIYRASNEAKETKAKISSRLFEEATEIPGGLAKFENLASKELERYGAEIKFLKEVTEENGLSPILSRDQLFHCYAVDQYTSLLKI